MSDWPAYAKWLVALAILVAVIGVGNGLDWILLGPEDHRGLAVVAACVLIIGALGFILTLSNLGVFKRPVRFEDVPINHRLEIMGYVGAAHVLALKLAEEHGNKAGPWLDELEHDLKSSWNSGVVTLSPEPEGFKESYQQGIGNLMRAVRQKLAC